MHRVHKNVLTDEKKNRRLTPRVEFAKKRGHLTWKTRYKNDWLRNAAADERREKNKRSKRERWAKMRGCAKIRRPRVQKLQKPVRHIYIFIEFLFALLPVECSMKNLPFPKHLASRHRFGSLVRRREGEKGERLITQDRGYLFLQIKIRRDYPRNVKLLSKATRKKWFVSCFLFLIYIIT